jgi:colicin import membrane protein
MAMAKITKTTARPKRSKTEVQQEFEEIRQEVEAAREAADLKSEEAARARDTEVRQAVDGVTAEAVVQKISALSLEVTRAMAGLATQISEEVQRLETVREAVALERGEIEKLHKIDIAATTLDQLVQDYARRKEQLEFEISSQRTAWEEERRQAEREQKEQEDLLKKQRQRETEEYEYKKSLERKKAQDKYDEERKLVERQNQEKQEALEKSWQQREAALKEKEDEWARWRKESEEFPQRIKQESERAVGEAVRAAQQRYDQQVLLLKKENESDKRLAELQIKTLQDTLTRQTAQTEALEKQLAEAKQQVQEIAVRAIEGASGARALAHINEIAIEQAKHRSPQG